MCNDMLRDGKPKLHSEFSVEDCSPSVLQAVVKLYVTYCFLFEVALGHIASLQDRILGVEPHTHTHTTP